MLPSRVICAATAAGHSIPETRQAATTNAANPTQREPVATLWPCFEHMAASLLTGGEPRHSSASRCGRTVGGNLVAPDAPCQERRVRFERRSRDLGASRAPLPSNGGPQHHRGPE